MKKLSFGRKIGSAAILAALVFWALATGTGSQGLSAAGAGGSRAKASVAGESDAAGKGEIVGQPTMGMVGKSETVAQIMERAKLAPPVIFGPRAADFHFEAELNKVENPDALPYAQWPPLPPGESAAIPQPYNPQTVGVHFKTVSLDPPSFPEAPYIPPDSMGDVGPTQILAATNGRIKVFDKTGVLGGLNADMDTFFTSVRGGFSTTDPQVRYDRLSGRWFVLVVNIPPTASYPNSVLIAVSSGSTITDATSFTFYSFALSAGGGGTTDNTNFCDYPSLGIDVNALYIGCNMFTTAGAFSQNTGFVVRKSSVTGGGPIVVTAFRTLATGAVAGPYSPRGVDNDDPLATEGYFIGVDTLTFSKLQIRRVSTPGGTPTISTNISLTVSTTNTISRQLSPTNTTQTNGIDASDDRLFQASIHKNKITGVSTLWTAHHVEVSTTCAGSSATNRRLGARWYEIGSLTGTPAVVQSGALCSSVTGAATVNSERGYMYPTVVETGQGHMALGASFASSAQSENPGVAVSGRLRTDTLGTIQAPTVVISGTGSYRLCDGASGACPRNRWGDYSSTDVDPNDDMTVWTFQEYSLDATGTGFGGNWAVRAVRLIAPPPATPSSASPSVCIGLSSASVTVTGTSASGSGFFDPGPDTGGPGYANHIAASVTGGVTVNSVTFTDPTHVTLSVNTSAASLGTQNVTITNPDAQAATGTNILTVFQTATPTASNGGPVCAGGTLQLTASTIAGATYSWTGPNGFTSGAQNPTVAGVTAAAAGSYNVTATVSGCTSLAGSTTVTVIANGGACSDGNACTQTDTCQSGACTGANPVICTPLDQCHDAGTCNPGNGICSNPTKPNGSACNDGNACTQTDTCQAGSCTGSNPVVCAPLNQCHVAGTCDTQTGLCSNPAKPDGTACGDAGTECVNQDTCLAGACADNGFKPSGTACGSGSSGACDNADTCDGSGSCQVNHVADGTACGDAGTECVNQDTCLAGACADNGFKPSGTACGSGSSGACDNADTCNGSGTCALNHLPDGTFCDDANVCTTGTSCGGGVCGGGTVILPAAVNNSVQFGGSGTTITWTDPPGDYSVYRGTLTGGAPWAYNQVCFDSHTSASSTTDATNPATGSMYFYLVTRYDACGESTPGSDSSGAPRPNPAPCP